MYKKASIIFLCILLAVFTVSPHRNTDNNTFIENNWIGKKTVLISREDVEWITMSYGVPGRSDVLFTGHDDEKIDKIINLINSGKLKGRSTDVEMKHSKRIRVLSIKLFNGDNIGIYLASENNPSNGTLLSSPDKFILSVHRKEGSEYYTVISRDMINYFLYDSTKDFKAAEIIKIEPNIWDNDNIHPLREGDKFILSGNGLTEKIGFIYIQKNGEFKNKYLIARVPIEYGEWRWEGVVSRVVETIDGKHITLENGLYDMGLEFDGGRVGHSGVIELIDK